MLEYIKGILTESSPLKATIEIQGLGYLFYIPLSTYSKLPPLGKEVLLYISAVIREDSHKSYGFISRLERDLFEKLNDISGVGPKTSLALIGHLEVADLQMAVTHANVALICKVPGIGKKTAERLVIEMRDKWKHLSDTSASSFSSKGDKEHHIVVSDAISALVNLGYNPLQAQKAVRSAFSNGPSEPALSELITAALRAL